MNNLESRKIVVIGVVALIGLIFILRLLYIQVIDDTYASSADNQALRYVTEYPARGIIYDRNGDVLVMNQAAYDLMVIPRQVDEMDTLAFCKLLSITLDEFKENYDQAQSYSNYRASIFKKQLSADEYGRLAERLYEFPGFFGQKRSLRIYPDSVAAHVLGYIGEVSPNQLETDSFYKSGDFIGISGIEKQYETALRGNRGREVLMVDVHNTVQGRYRGGALDIQAKAGIDLISSIDLGIQRYGEQLMNHKKGSIVAIEPKTGEVICLISSPTYDPNLLVGVKRAKNYQLLAANDSLNPLFNRALMAKYPPGSIFKLIQSLIGLEAQVITERTGISCNKALVGCHNHPNCQNLREAIQMSCNPYYHEVFRRLINRNEAKSYFEDSALGMEKWSSNVRRFGLGSSLALDLPNLKAGSVPDASFYDKIYGKRRWAFSTIYSLSIGQGELEVVPIQMANLAGIIANKGYYIDPHLIKTIEDTSQTLNWQRHDTGIDTAYFRPIIDAMEWVVSKPGGTARRARIDGIKVCGKTGTAENPHGKDHSVFIAFAPKNDPQIAVAVYVENSGFGGTWAAPIASLMIEKYLTGKTDSIKEARILEADLIAAEDEGEE